MVWNRYAHPNESSGGYVPCVPGAIFAESFAVKSNGGPLHLFKFHARVVLPGRNTTPARVGERQASHDHLAGALSGSSGGRRSTVMVAGRGRVAMV